MTINNKIIIATIKVKEFAKRLPSLFIKILALRNRPNIKATIPKGIIKKSAIKGIITKSFILLFSDANEINVQNKRNEQKKILNKKPFTIFLGSFK